MEPVPGILDEAFFRVATNECLDALATLISPVLAGVLQEYRSSSLAQADVISIIDRHLGSALDAITFHETLYERKSSSKVRAIVLQSLAIKPIDSSLLEELEFLQQNYQHIRTTMTPPTFEEFLDFLSTAPDAYSATIAANQDLFYTPRAKPRSTGGYTILQKANLWQIALKGLRFKGHIAQKGKAYDGYLIKEF